MIIFLAIDFVFISKVNCTISLKPSASSPESVQRAFVCVGSVRCRSSRRASGRESRKTLFFGFLFRIIFRTKAKRNVRHKHFRPHAVQLLAFGATTLQIERSKSFWCETRAQRTIPLCNAPTNGILNVQTRLCRRRRRRVRRCSISHVRANRRVQH